MPATKLETPVMLTETATLPFASQVIILENVPPGQDATNNMPNANIGSIFNAQVAKHVIAGSMRNWITNPMIGALGFLIIRRKSLGVNSNETPNIITAIMIFKPIRLSGLKLSASGSIIFYCYALA